MAEGQINPGSGRRVRATYIVIGAGTLIATAFMFSLPVYFSATDPADASPSIVVLGIAVAAVTLAFLLAAAGQGVLAVGNDRVDLPRVRASARLARIGGYIGWCGTPTPLVLGTLLYFVADDGFGVMLGLICTVCCLIPAWVSDTTFRLATRLSHARPT
ncbi:hypothetical protein AB0M54_32355 [Actinoplanes sp. NPDC051470]|uniref:hypothetical protein n=1 Tax=Actinoplanes sp. NPDC051470 TaxID=3157224 RepID=UPI003449A6EC